MAEKPALVIGPAGALATGMRCDDTVARVPARGFPSEREGEVRGLAADGDGARKYRGGSDGLRAAAFRAGPRRRHRRRRESGAMLPGAVTGGPLRRSPEHG